MSRIFVTGSTDGLGKMAAQLLIDQGHQVVLYARSKVRPQEALAALNGDLSGKIFLLQSFSRTTQTWMSPRLIA
jgi:short-subunit dehydrogenase